jgi:hypothetical protein
MFQVKKSQKFVSKKICNLKKLKKILEHQINQSKMFPKKGGWDMFKAGTCRPKKVY